MIPNNFEINSSKVKDTVAFNLMIYRPDLVQNYRQNIPRSFKFSTDIHLRVYPIDVTYNYLILS